MSIFSRDRFGATMRSLKLSAIFLALNSGPARAELPIGQPPPAVELVGGLGGRLDGATWSSAEIKDKVYTLFYVDPDEKDLNDDAAQALKKENFDLAKYGSIAIINMAATWAPNFLIQSNLEKKQKEFVNTTYVKDLKKTIVDKWKIADDSSDVMAFDRVGKIIFSKDGKLSAEDIAKLIAAIRANIGE